jgi:hypothetical protein
VDSYSVEIKPSARKELEALPFKVLLGGETLGQRGVHEKLLGKIRIVLLVGSSNVLCVGGG